MPNSDNNRNRNGKKNYFTLGIIFSLAAHFIFSCVLFVAAYVKKLNTPAAPIVVELELAPANSEKEMAEIFNKKPITLPNNQIVQQDENQANNLAPDDTRFLSAKNQKVEKQTVAKNAGEFQNLKSSKSQKAGNPDSAEQAAKTKPGPKGKNDIKDLMPTLDAYAMMKKQLEQDSNSAKGEWKAKSDSGGDVSQTNDYLKEMDKGLETQLNTKEYKYYGYYTRIRKQLSHYWEPKVREKLSTMFRQGRNVASNADRITKLLIVLNPQGTLVNVQILSESGVQDLDEAAIEAFRSAAPFPNPPKGIVDPDGTVKIRWDFILET